MAVASTAAELASRPPAGCDGHHAIWSLQGPASAGGLQRTRRQHSAETGRPAGATRGRLTGRVEASGALGGAGQAAYTPLKGVPALQLRPLSIITGRLACHVHGGVHGVGNARPVRADRGLAAAERGACRTTYRKRPHGVCAAARAAPSRAAERASGRRSGGRDIVQSGRERRGQATVCRGKQLPVSVTDDGILARNPAF